MKFLKNKKCKICIVLLVTLVLICGVTSSYAAINDGGASTFSQGVAETFKTLVQTLLNANMGVLGATIAPLINVFAILIFLILYILFVATGFTGGSASTMLSFPFPDQIVFNKIPLLDPNFINPANGSVGALTNGIFSKMYSSFFVLATTIFTIAALVIGIKLVFSSLAAEKAKYKEALGNWIMGIIMLFLVHYLLAGMFYLNEEIVKAVSEGVVDNITIPFNVTDALPGIGKSISKVVKLFNSAAGTSFGVIELKGFGGIVLKYAVQALIGQDLISSIIFLIIIGQTFGLMITYVKRVFMCIFLGILAPLVVAVDVVQKSLK